LVVEFTLSPYLVFTLFKLYRAMLFVCDSRWGWSMNPNIPGLILEDVAANKGVLVSGKLALLDDIAFALLTRGR
jgi:hypothetical protein